MPRIARLLTVALIAVSAIIVRPQAAAPVGTMISGGGLMHATDDSGMYFANAGQFSISAGLRADGSAFGSLNLVGRGAFAAAWGACPYDPRCEDFPNTATKTLHLSGDVRNVTADGGTVVAYGQLTEIDHGKGDGIIFEEYEVPFSVTATEGSKSVVLQFCLIPPFTLDIVGNLSVNAGTPQTGLLQRPGQPAVQALQCRAPVPATR